MTCTGNEKFVSNGKELDITVLDFWRFSYSDLNSDPSALSYSDIKNEIDAIIQKKN